MQLSPDQFSSLKRIISTPASKVAGIINGDIDQISAIIKNLEHVARRHATTLGSNRVLFIHIKGESGGRKLDDASLADLLRSNTPIISLGDDASILNASTGIANSVSASTESDAGPRMSVLCEAGLLILFAAGKPIAEIGSAPPVLHGRSDWARSHKELRRCMDDHFKHCIDDEKNVRYWSNKNKRILLSGVDKTEKIFHHNLFWWLNHLLSDALAVYGETIGMGQDKTDITIVTEVGQIVIEVKWLGENQNGTKHGELRIREGIEQVAIYLNKNDKLYGGYVVFYDARKEDLHKTESTFPDGCLHARCEHPIIYFLNSETPSLAAHRIANT